MIVFELKCGNDHRFESWFKDSAAFEKQRKSKTIMCPTCDSNDIEKALMAPAVQSSKTKKRAMQQQVMAASAMKAAEKYRDYVEKNCEDVGTSFPEEARKIHYGEQEARNIYGEATLKEAKELVDEGVEVAPVPVLPKKKPDA